MELAARLGQPLSALLLKNLLPALLQCRAAALSLFVQKVTHRLDVFQHCVQFDNLPLFQLLPAD